MSHSGPVSSENDCNWMHIMCQTVVSPAKYWTNADVALQKYNNITVLFPVKCVKINVLSKVIVNKNIFVYFHFFQVNYVLFYYLINLFLLENKTWGRQTWQPLSISFVKKSAYRFHSHAVTHVPEILSGRNCAVLLQIYFTTLDTWLNKNKIYSFIKEQMREATVFFLFFANYAFWLGLQYVMCTFATKERRARRSV